MFEQEIEMEKKEGSSFGPILIIFLLIALFIGGFGVVIYQNKQTIKPEEASAIVESRLKAGGPVQLAFDIGNVSYSALDPQYKLLEKAGILKIGKIKGYSYPVELTAAGKELIASFPDVKGVPDKNGTTYTLPLASRKLVSIGKITKLGQQRVQIQYTWAWETTKAGEMFDIPGKLVQGLSVYERGVLIDQHGAKYYHAAPTETAIVLEKSDKGWAPASVN